MKESEGERGRDRHECTHAHALARPRIRAPYLPARTTARCRAPAMALRKGMLVKNVVEETVSIRMAGRVLELGPGDEALVTAVEVKDPVLREHLQIRTIAIVRPATDAEGETLDAASAGE